MKPIDSWTFRVDGLRLYSEANTRDHWRKRHARTKAQHWAIWAAMVPIRGELFRRIKTWQANRSILEVRITRIGPRKLDCDNLSGSAKAVRDAIAKGLGVDDGSPMYRWVYAQAKGPYAVEIELVRPLEATDRTALELYNAGTRAHIERMYGGGDG